MAATTEDQLLSLIVDTQSNNEIIRKQAEQHLSGAERNPAYLLSLIAIASHSNVALENRQSALLLGRTWIEKYWNPADQENAPGHGLVILDDQSKEQIRNTMFKLATSEDCDRKIRSVASYVVTKIAVNDFPHQWPSLLPTLLHIIPNASDQQLNGALKVLSDLVEDALTEEQFFLVARDILKVVYDVAISEARKPVLRAMAISIFRETFDIMEMIKQDHGNEVKEFADEALKLWLPLFLNLIKRTIPIRNIDSNDDHRRGIIALKLQVVKTLMKIRLVFPKLLLPQTIVFFSATWAELNLLKEEYQSWRLEDADGLPYTLDFLVLEELDFLQSCLKAPLVQKELELQLQEYSKISESEWVFNVMKLAVYYAQITKEEEDLWDIDVNLFLAEEISVTTNYTARTACADLLIKLGEWLHQAALEGLLIFSQRLFSAPDSTWRMREAALYLLTQLLNDFMDIGKIVAPEIIGACFGLIEYAISRNDEPLLRARGYLIAGIVVQSIPDMSLDFLTKTIKSINSDESEVVKVSCIKSIQGWVKDRSVPEHQLLIISAISEYLYSKDMTELADADDLLVTLVETLRASINIDPCITVGDSPVLDLLFQLAKHGAANFQMTMLVTETFEDIVKKFSGTDLFTQLCLKVLPSLTGAFDVGKITGDSPLVELATELLAVLTENGSKPLPSGYVAASLPKLICLLMATSEGGILRAGAETVKFMLMHDHPQVFAWHDEHNKSGLEVCLILIDKLLSPSVEDNAASEVGGLAAELVEKAGRERLGPYLEQLLRAVASRLASAEAPSFIQSLILVFARLSLTGERDVVDFLSQIEINGLNGLQVVMSKWLENSINFAGYSEIRQNVIALSKLYSLNDSRLAQIMVRGDQIIPASDIIVTRSRAKTNPVKYTIVPAPIKILKVLIEEFLSASGHLNKVSLGAIAAAADEEEEKDEWEDVPTSLDLSNPSVKADLMTFAEANYTRQRDDETQAYLTEFFLRTVRENIGGFSNWYTALTAEEQDKLKEIAREAGVQPTTNQPSEQDVTFGIEKDVDFSNRIKPTDSNCLQPGVSKTTPAHGLDSPIKLPHLSSTLKAASHTKNEAISNYNVVFAAASLKSAAALIPQACEMARWQRNNVHFLIMGRDDIPMNTLKSFNGIGENCKVKFHNARPDFSMCSSNTRMKSSVLSAFKEVNKFLKPEAILVDASRKEELWFREWIKSKAPDIEITIIELPENAEEKLKWTSLLDAKSLSAWNQVSVEIIIHPQPSATGSLVRLLESLKKADYFSSKPPHLTIELPHNIEEQTSHYLNEFKWPPFNNPSQGNLLTLHHRIPQYDLTPEENSIRLLESFWPSDPFGSQVLVLSTQAEVSPLFFHYLKYLILEYKFSSEGSEKQDSLLGISLDLPSSYLNDTTSFEAPKINKREFLPFLWQAPNSNACLFFADKWIELHDFVSRSLNSQHTLPASNNPATSVKYVSKTFPSWLEYILQLARLRGYMTLYPNFGNKFSLLTIHNELYRVPEEYKPDLESESSFSSDSNGGSKKYLSLKRKENPLIVDSLFSSLLAQGKLPDISDLLMISWDGEELDASKLDTLTTNYQNLFRKETGGCTEEVSKKQVEFSAGDLFCLKDEKHLMQPQLKG
ncbi:hypothetical protein EPUL_000976 [Erysiphe pulchra]|uniref:Importin N-terminal domain-containing protein n=1 Tax=Erysiphe pulchra TaxID=225359 RepID=A0A2S4PXG0_9PEZI|nr:hypothetical protein EPUL_000976 [Erysiphe pulchra]